MAALLRPGVGQIYKLEYMFNSIIIRKSLPGSADVDIGLMAECLLFYEKVHVIADMSMLRKIVEHIGLDILAGLPGRP